MTILTSSRDKDSIRIHWMERVFDSKKEMFGPSTLLVFEAQNVGGDFDEERVQLGLVPLVEDVGHFGRRHAEDALHQVVGLGDQLHVAVLDAVVHHLHEVTGALVADPIAARLSVRFRRNRLQHIERRWPVQNSIRTG